VAGTTGSRSSRVNTLLDDFLSEYCVIYLVDAITTIQTESGEVADIPLIVEGTVWDYDPDFILLGDDSKTTLSLVARKYVAKIDMIDKSLVVSDDPSKPPKGQMN
jgi:hypothetical protein